MERISIFNYEAFYLDFLEGNLSEEDTVILFEFLKAHPELEVDLEEVPTIDTSLIKMDAEFLDGLKQVDFVSDKITLKNIDYFMIANLEGQLDSAKEEELMFMLSQDSTLLNDYENIQKLKLAPDTTIVFADKASLKQTRKLVFWPYVAAAASILLFLFIYQGFRTETNSDDKLAASIDPKVKNQNSTSEKTIITPKNGDRKNVEKDRVKDLTIEKNRTIESKNQADNNLLADVATDPKNKQPNKKDFRAEIKLSNIDRKEIQLSPSKNPEFIEVANNLNSNEIEQTNPTKNADYSMTGMNEMKNPIKPITNRLSELTKTEIDLRTTQKNADKRKGFYLKIGKFEIERKGR